MRQGVGVERVGKAYQVKEPLLFHEARAQLEEMVLLEIDKGKGIPEPAVVENGVEGNGDGNWGEQNNQSLSTRHSVQASILDYSIDAPPRDDQPGERVSAARQVRHEEWHREARRTDGCRPRLELEGPKQTPGGARHGPQDRLVVDDAAREQPHQRGA